ncbi:MAG: 23S rRNA (uracil(1939)-C(5))-methyltransferase RlmD [Candidatus Izimaplasma sp.]|nr:23S rRNA (uracil(1939)-C(5))-methyltransferase RlmD [Candidatus Izimaplasma bacterium]
MSMLEKGQKVLLTIKRLGINGEGIGYYKRKAVFVDGAIPPEEVIVVITKVFDNYAMGDIDRIKLRAQQRVKPFCKHYDMCGGCQIQHINYNEQLLLKQEMIEQTFERYTNLNLKKIPFKLMEGMRHPTHYRHKSQMPVRNTKTGLTTGLYQKDSNDLVDVVHCPVHTEFINQTNEEIITICDRHKIYAFDPKTMYGLLRYIVIRQSHLTDEIQVTLVVTIFNKALFDVANEIIKLPNVVSVGISKNRDVSNIEIFGDNVEILAGKETIREGIADIVYDLKAKAFYQLNPVQAIKLYQYVKEQINDIENKTIIDGYCGAGAMSLYLGKYAKQLIGIDISKESIESAIHNAKENKFDHISFREGAMKDILPKLYDEGLQPNVIVVDPPRSGLHNETIDILNRNVIDQIVYVSCNPSTLTKNIKLLSRRYKVKYVMPFDMFPHTSHIESVTILEKK